MSLHLTYVPDGVVQVTAVSNGAATKRLLVVEADIYFEKEGNTEGQAK
jgi:hypothetical protein